MQLAEFIACLHKDTSLLIKNESGEALFEGRKENIKDKKMLESKVVPYSAVGQNGCLVILLGNMVP